MIYLKGGIVTEKLYKCFYCKQKKPGKEFVLKSVLLNVCFDCSKAENDRKGIKSISKEEFMRKKK